MWFFIQTQRWNLSFGKISPKRIANAKMPIYNQNFPIIAQVIDIWCKRKKEKLLQMNYALLQCKRFWQIPCLEYPISSKQE